MNIPNTHIIAAHGHCMAYSVPEELKKQSHHKVQLLLFHFIAFFCQLVFLKSGVNLNLYFILPGNRLFKEKSVIIQYVFFVISFKKKQYQYGSLSAVIRCSATTFYCLCKHNFLSYLFKLSLYTDSSKSDGWFMNKSKFLCLLLLLLMAFARFHRRDPRGL